MLTPMVDAMEDRDATTVDMPNVFVQTKLPTNGLEEEQVMMKTRGKLALLMVQTNPALHQKCTTTEKGQPVSSVC